MKPAHLLNLILFLIVALMSAALIGVSTRSVSAASKCDDTKFNCTPLNKKDPFTQVSAYPTVCIDHVLYFAHGLGNLTPSTPVMKLIGSSVPTASAVNAGYTQCGD